MKAVLAFVVLCALASPLAAATAQTSPAREIAAKEPVSAVVLVKASDAIAVIRAGGGPLEKIKVGDLIGATKAVVKEIGAGRIVLDETFTGNNGTPNRALIVIKEGERGGTRYLQRADEPPFTGTRPVPVTPAAPPVTKTPPKKP